MLKFKRLNFYSMKYMFLFWASLFLQAHFLAQPTIQWQKTFGGNFYDEPKCIIQTSDGGYIVTGNTLSLNGDVIGNHGNFDFWVIKLNESGALEWKKTFGGDNSDWPYAIRQTVDGGYIIAGETYSNNEDVSGNHGDKDAWIVKLKSDGNIEWQKTYGGTALEEAVDIQQTIDGGYIFAGIASSSNGDVTGVYGDWDFWVVKLNQSGIIEWQKTFGGTYRDNANAIQQTSDGGYIVAGETLSYDGDVAFNNGNVDGWIIKLSSDGAIEWQKSLGGNALDTSTDVHQTSEGGFIVAGLTGSLNSGDVTENHGIFDFWVVKLNNSGQIEWQKALGGSEPDRCRNIVPTNDGMYVAFGQTESTDGDVANNDGGADFWIVKLGATGDIIWQKTLGGTKAESGRSIQQTTDNGYILTGYTWSTDGDLTGSTNHGQNDFWVVKLAPETVGVTETPNPLVGQLEVFPNPAQQSFTLKTGSDASELRVVMTDVLGRRLLEKNIPNGGSIHMGSLPDGVYWVQATDERGRIYAARLRKKV